MSTPLTPAERGDLTQPAQTPLTPADRAAIRRAYALDRPVGYALGEILLTRYEVTLAAAEAETARLRDALAQLDAYCARGGGDWSAQSAAHRAGLDLAYTDVQRWLRSYALLAESET